MLWVVSLCVTPGLLPQLLHCPSSGSWTWTTQTIHFIYCSCSIWTPDTHVYGHHPQTIPGREGSCCNKFYLISLATTRMLAKPAKNLAKIGLCFMPLLIQKKGKGCAAHVTLRTTMRLMISAAVTIRCDQSSNSNQAAQIRGVENKKFIFVRLHSCAGGVQMCQIECHYNKQQSHNW